MDTEEQTLKDLVNIVHDENVANFRQLDPPVTPEEVKKVRLKMDLRLPPLLYLIYIATWLDRGNIGNAALMGFKTDIGLDSRGYSLAVSIFFIGTLTGDLFSNIGMRYVRPSIWISSAMVIWSAIAMSMAAVKNPAQIYALRYLLGVFESAFISGAPYLVTFWYPRNEWGRRIAVYFAATPTAGAFGGWIAYGIALISSSKLKTWQALFLIEGGLTFFVALASFYVLPDRPHNTRWLKPREREVAEWRMLQDGNRTHGHFGFKDILKVLPDWRLWITIIIFMTQNLSMYTVTTFTPLIVNSFGYSNVRSQFMTAPPYCVGIVLVFVLAQISDRLRVRAAIFAVNSIFVSTGYLMLLFVPQSNTTARYGALFLIIPGIVSGVVMSIGNITDNCCGDLKKGIANGLLQACGSLMGIAVGYLVPSTDAPAYTMAYWTLFSVTAFGGVLAALMSVYFSLENKRRDKLFGKPPGEIIDFSELGEKHPYWRFTP